VTGWLAAAALAWHAARLRRRLEAVGDAEHELRGALTAFAFVPELSTELDRARAALGDLVEGGRAPSRGAFSLQRAVRSAIAAWEPAARAAGRRVELDWSAGPVLLRADRGRLAQVLGNLLANAVEHGAGPIRVRATRERAGVRLEVANDLDRGRGLRIAARAAEECGGTLSLIGDERGAAATVDLPLAS
jgi:signal transduction histidine kinase